MTEQTRAAVLIEVVSATGTVLPAVVTGTAQDANIERELLVLTHNLHQKGWGMNYLRHINRTIASLVTFYAAEGTPTLDADGMIDLVWRFLWARANGTMDSNKNDPKGLYWRPVRWRTLKKDLRAIATYSDFCATQFGYFPMIRDHRIEKWNDCSISVKTFHKLKAQTKRDFFAHLAVLRRKMPGLLPTVPLRSPTIGRSNGGDGDSLSLQFVWDLYESERNQVYKMVWLLGAFGGPRFSEQVNLWLCDILPGSYRQALFARDPFRELPLVVLADPWNATYCGTVGDQRYSRKQFLKEKYGLLPRPDLDIEDAKRNVGKRAGWKGMLMTNTSLAISQVFWTDREAASLYYKHAEWLLDLHSSLGTQQRHPYFLINTDPRKPEVLGNMLSMSNVKKAWERACWRLGLQPYRLGRRIHKLRHFYKDFLEHALKLPRGIRRVMLHQCSEDSQDAYGSIDWTPVRHALAGRRTSRILTP